MKLLFLLPIAIAFSGSVSAQPDYIEAGAGADNAYQNRLQHVRPDVGLFGPAAETDSVMQRAEQAFYAVSKSSEKGAVLQKSSDEMFRTDSIVRERLRLKFTYDDTGNNTVTERWFYNFFGNLQNITKYQRQFEGSDMVSETRISVGVESFEETFQNRRDYTYASGGALLTEKFSTWEEDGGAFESQWLITFTTDEDGLLESMVRCNYADGNEEECVNSTRTDYTYNDAQLETERRNSNWDDDQEEWAWITRWQTTYENDLPVLEQRFFWNGEIWQVTQQNITEYNSDGLLTLYETQNFNQNDEVWNPSFRSLIEYNDAGLEDEYVFQSWVAGEWRNSSRGLFGYDAEGNTTQGNYYFWNNNASEWVEDYSSEMEYDLDVPAANVIPAIQDDFVIWFRTENKILQKEITGNPEEKGPGSALWTYYYSPVTILNAREKKGPEVNLYPNPVSDELFVDFAGFAAPAVLTIHDLQGRAVMQKHVNTSTSFSLGRLSKGTYVYTLSSTEINQSGKLIKVE